MKHLSIPEIRHLRLQLSHSPVCDILDLPLELIIRIFTILPLEDALSLRRVSRKWNNILSSADFCHGMTKESFPAEWDQMNQLIAQQSGDMKEEIATRFHKAAIYHIKRSRGIYSSMGVYWYHTDPSVEHSDYQYSNGRVAVGLRSDSGTHKTIRVKNLCSNDADRIYMDGRRESFTQWLLSDTYLICKKVHP